ncbi:hypothetical protein [Niabella drilacis]|uniref:DUF4369 domain-containing protein n=1 Tax=Niabella drilacis (strain DSM 25811 / CCM 8410 / CCUG 62505 / LMG 26954 / E90) TaxID=1285928 RepID=A0A1G6V1W1_NIADE|nr:hypothetical protein [Niabella drilacis]SDD47481.1 hypothetical protein SAMN04487894_109162 [Niabella drilacis]
MKFKLALCIQTLLLLITVAVFSQEKSKVDLAAEMAVIFNPDKADTGRLIAIGISFKNETGSNIYIPQASERLLSKNRKTLSLYRNGVLFKEIDGAYYSGRSFAQIERPPLPKNVVVQSFDPISLERMSGIAKGKFLKFIIDSIAMKNKNANNTIVQRYLNEKAKLSNTDTIGLRAFLLHECLFLNANDCYKNYFVVLLDIQKLLPGRYEIRYAPQLTVLSEKNTAIKKILNYDSAIPSQVVCNSIYFDIL